MAVFVRALSILLLLTLLFAPVQCVASCGNASAPLPPCHGHDKSGKSQPPSDCLQQHITEEVRVDAAGHAALFPLAAAAPTIIDPVLLPVNHAFAIREAVFQPPSTLPVVLRL